MESGYENFDIIMLPKYNQAERVEILGQEHFKEKKKLLISKINSAFSTFFKHYGHVFEENELPIPVFAEIEMQHEDYSWYIEYITLYDSESRTIDEWESLLVKRVYRDYVYEDECEEALKSYIYDAVDYAEDIYTYLDNHKFEFGEGFGIY